MAALRAVPVPRQTELAKEDVAAAEWRLYRRMMNSPDAWQRIYWEAMCADALLPSSSEAL